MTIRSLPALFLSAVFLIGLAATGRLDAGSSRRTTSPSSCRTMCR